MNPLKMLPLLFVLLFSFSSSAHTHHQDFLQCLFNYDNSISNLIHTPNNTSYSSILQSTIQNLRFNTTAMPKPILIVTPLNPSHIQATIRCAQEYGLHMRIRSGGHDYEGLSYVSPLPFVILDLVNFRNISIDVENSTAWVQSGATLGELFYRIAEQSRTLAFHAGSCPSVGVGGFFSGGGYGYLMRKHGFAADNVIDAELIDVKGRILNRDSMGEDLFWAIRGGGGNTFGVVISWKVNLVQVPSIVTVFTVTRPFDQNTSKLIHRWQYVASKLPDDIMVMARISGSGPGNRTRVYEFYSLFLGGIDSLVGLMEERFPELGLKKQDCIEMSWIRSVLYFAGFPINSSLDILLDRINQFRLAFKSKSDYVKEPIPETALQGLLEMFSEMDIEFPMFIMTPYGGKMDEIAESSLPYPHRAGNLYQIAYMVIWQEQSIEAAEKHISWIRRIYRYMAPYVSKNPRGAYVNYRDLDIGTNSLIGHTSYKQVSIWGKKYFMDNFSKLVHIKTLVDPLNYFRNEQSIPPFSQSCSKRSLKDEYSIVFSIM